MHLTQENIRLICLFIIYLILTFSFLPYATSITASVRSDVEGEGFHRTLKYYIDTGSFKNKSCYIAIIVQLPSSLFANVDKLADLRRLRQSTSCVEGEIDVELFAEKAYYQNVTVCSRLSNTKTILSIPIHQRYRFPSLTGEPFNVSIPQPKLLLGCKERVKEHRISKTTICWPCIEYSKKWRDVPFHWEGDNGFIWQIPVGNTSWKLVITSITLFVTLTGAVYVLKTIFNSYRVPRNQRISDTNQRKAKDN